MHVQTIVNKLITPFKAVLTYRENIPWKNSGRMSFDCNCLFLYVIYSIILLCVIGAIIGIWWPQQTFQAAENLSKLLGVIPETFGGCSVQATLATTGARSFDKWRGADR